MGSRAQSNSSVPTKAKQNGRTQGQAADPRLIFVPVKTARPGVVRVSGSDISVRHVW